MNKIFLLPFIFISISLLILVSPLSAQTKFESPDTLRLKAYQTCYDALSKNLLTDGSLKESIFMVENTFSNGKYRYQDFCDYIKVLTSLCKMWQLANPLKNYKFKDSTNFLKNSSIYTVIKDTIEITSQNEKSLYHIPYTYDFEDFDGRNDWNNMFVTKLLITHKGNCHSLPYLYKILADELEATCWLSFAPNHIYIKNRCQKIGWYNTELTSGDFPIDAWILTSGYIPIDAVRSGIYMDTLSNKQTIAQCVLDLAKGYEFQTKNYYDGFILKCCDLTLKYHPQNVQALLLKAETLKRIYENHGKVKSAVGMDTYAEMEKLYIQLFELGYREMPDKMYMQWLKSVTKERNKYTNMELKATLSKH